MATTYTKIGDILTAFWKRAKKVVDAGDAETLEAAEAYTDSAILTNVTNKLGAANGIAQLDANGQIPASQLTISAMEFKGSWDASTNTPELADGTGNSGDFYIVSVAGTQFDTEFLLNDRIIYDGSVNKWVRLVGDTVLSVNGVKGAVSLNADNLDYEAGTAAVTYTLTSDDITSLNNGTAITVTVNGESYTFTPETNKTDYAEGDVVTLKDAVASVSISDKIDSLTTDMENIAANATSITTDEIDTMIGTVTSEDSNGNEVITYVPDEIEATVEDE